MFQPFLFVIVCMHAPVCITDTVPPCLADPPPIYHHQHHPEARRGFPLCYCSHRGRSRKKERAMNDRVKRRAQKVCRPFDTHTHTLSHIRTHLLGHTLCLPSFPPSSLVPFIPEQPFKRLGTCAVVFCLFSFLIHTYPSNLYPTITSQPNKGPLYFCAIAVTLTTVIT